MPDEKITNADADLLSDKVRNELGKTRVRCYLGCGPITEYFDIGTKTSGELQTLRRQHLKKHHKEEILEAKKEAEEKRQEWENELNNS